MPKPKKDDAHKDTGDDQAKAARERELRELLERVEAKKSGEVPPSNESAHDFVERRMRDKSKK
jgi:hypothetical protein